eukprot:scaffold62927_cov32-Tisochrysis_lutea.AAC.1
MAHLPPSPPHPTLTAPHGSWGSIGPARAQFQFQAAARNKRLAGSPPRLRMAPSARRARSGSSSRPGTGSPP